MLNAFRKLAGVGDLPVASFRFAFIRVYPRLIRNGQSTSQWTDIDFDGDDQLEGLALSICFCVGN